MPRRSRNVAGTKQPLPDNIAVLPTGAKSQLLGYDPVSLSRTVVEFRARFLSDHGVELNTSTDFADFFEIRSSLRGAPPQPAFNPLIHGNKLDDRCFWVSGKSDGKTVLLLAYRLNTVDRDFRDWVIAWQMWLHAMAGDDTVILPPDDLRPLSTMVLGLRGPVAYAGELWLCKSIRPGADLANRVVDHTMQFGNILAWQAWRPEAVFGLSWYETARSGQMARMQQQYYERAFYEWRKRPKCVERPAGADRENEEILVFTPKELLQAQVLDAQKRLNSE